MARPVKSRKSDAGDEREDREPFERVRDARERRPREELGVDGPELGEQQRNRREPGRDVQALGDAVQAGRTRRKEEPTRRVLREVGVQTGQEADRERDAERGSEQCGVAFVVQAARERSVLQ